MKTKRLESLRLQVNLLTKKNNSMVQKIRDALAKSVPFDEKKYAIDVINVLECGHAVKFLIYRNMVSCKSRAERKEILRLLEDTEVQIQGTASVLDSLEEVLCVSCFMDKKKISSLSEAPSRVSL